MKLIGRTEMSLHMHKICLHIYSVSNALKYFKFEVSVEFYKEK